MVLIRAPPSWAGPASPGIRLLIPCCPAATGSEANGVPFNPVLGAETSSKARPTIRSHLQKQELLCLGEESETRILAFHSQTHGVGMRLMAGDLVPALQRGGKEENVPCLAVMRLVKMLCERRHQSRHCGARAHSLMVRCTRAAKPTRAARYRRACRPRHGDRLPRRREGFCWLEVAKAGGPLAVKVAGYNQAFRGKPDGRRTNTALSLYCTSYEQDYGKKGFIPCLGHHSGTGFSANLRPAVYYTPSLDQPDNPKLWVSLLDSFQSQTKQHYPQLVVPSGTEPLPSARAKSRQSRQSGYLQLHTQPRPKTLSCQTEYKGSYAPHWETVSVSRKHQVVGAKQESGFTKGSGLKYNTSLPQNVLMDEAGQTQRSVTGMDLLPAAFLQGSEMFPRWVTQTGRETAFSRDARHFLACPASQLERPSGYRRVEHLSAGRSVGLKEASGYVLNAPMLKTLSDTPSDPLQFLSHYQSKFCATTSPEGLKPDWKMGGISRHRASGFSGRDTDRFNLCGY
ncbi:stabilizer of axonemal microtubules 4 [Brachyhypopomus gauderio]|uniref:stabilizer of axonemal microtubules 4 n=1 Tax=Brachyhypopomus gauderio TaxID=698409 RepID=UPI00404203A0